MSKIRYAIIGSGLMGHEHIRNLALLPDAIVTAVADPDAGMRESAARLAGPQCQAFDDYKTLLGADVADALVIASPNFTHVTVLHDVMARNLPILVEKPLCTNVADCRSVIAAARTRTAPVWVAMEYRFMPPVSRLIEGVHSGVAGKLRMVAIREHRYPFLKKVNDWNRFARYSGGTLVEKCCHFFDLMRVITKAEPIKVYASGGMDVNHLDERYGGEKPDILDNAFVTVDFDNGVRGLLDLCMFAEASRDEQEIAATGDKGKIECGIPSSTLLVGDRATRQMKHETIPVDENLLAAGHHHGSTFFQHQGFLEMVRTKGKPAVTLEDGLRAVAMGAAAEESVRTGLPVRMDV